MVGSVDQVESLRLGLEYVDLDAVVARTEPEFSELVDDLGVAIRQAGRGLSNDRGSLKKN